MIRAVLWDFGGVLTTSPFEAFNRFESEAGLPRDFIRTVNATNPDSNAWARIERAEIGLDDFSEMFERESAAAGHAIPGKTVLELLAGDVRPEMVVALKRCREVLKCACLTNNFALGDGETVWPARTQSLAEIMDLFHLVLESSRIGVRKPDPRMYQIACERLAVEPSEAVFLDDLGINLKPARAMGITTIKVTDPAGAIDELAATIGFDLS